MSRLCQSTHNKDRNSKQGFGLEQDWADVGGKSMDFSKPIPGWTNLPSTKKTPREVEFKDIKEVLTSEDPQNM